MILKSRNIYAAAVFEHALYVSGHAIAYFRVDDRCNPVYPADRYTNMLVDRVIV